MKVIIDRFEGDYAVVEMADRTTANLDRKLLPGAGEGDAVEITVRPAETAAAQKKVEKLMKEVWND